MRILADGMGGRFMPAKQWDRLRRAGVQVGIFFPPVLGRLNLRVNYRNHRKIIYRRRRYGYVGGFNIGREYVSKDPKFGYRERYAPEILRGGCAGAADPLRWTGTMRPGRISLRMQNILNPIFPRTGNRCGRIPENTPVFTYRRSQIIASGPDTMYRQIRDIYLELFIRQRSISISRRLILCQMMQQCCQLSR